VTATAEAAGSSHSHVKDILRLAVPAMLALASQPLLSIGDTAMIGRLGVERCGSRHRRRDHRWDLLDFAFSASAQRHWWAITTAHDSEPAVKLIFTPSFSHCSEASGACAGLLFATRFTANGCRAECNHEESPTFAFISPALHLLLYFLPRWDSSAAH
jgi:Na+-driven multidrug efflux pump